MEKKNKQAGCCSCGTEFKKEVKDMEKQGTAPTKSEHEKKRSEVDAAFKSEQKPKK